MGACFAIDLINALGPYLNGAGALIGFAILVWLFK